MCCMQPQTHAANVQLDCTRITTDQNVSRVQQTHTPRHRVTPLLPVAVTLVGRGRMVTVWHVCLASIRPALGLVRARTVEPANIQTWSMQAQTRVVHVQRDYTRITTDQSVSRVQQTHTPRKRVPALPPVAVMLVGRDKTVTVQPVCLASIRPALGLLRAHTVEPGNIQTWSMQPQTRAVHVQRDYTRITTDQNVSRAQQTHTPRHRVTPLLPVAVMLVGRDKTVTVQRVCLASIRPALGLLRAHTVELENIQKCCMQPQTHAANVQLDYTRITTNQSVSRVLQTHSPRHRVTPLLRVAVTQVGRDKMMTVQPVCLASTKLYVDQRGAVFVEQTHMNGH